MALEIPYSVKPTNNVNIDFYYGPWASVAEAIALVPVSVRLYRTVGIVTNDIIVEYWWKSGNTDEDLIVKLDALDFEYLSSQDDIVYID